MKKLYLALSALVAGVSANAQITLLQTYTNNTSVPVGSYQGVTMREAGFSSLYYIPGTQNEFFTISDRGTNIDAGSANCATTGNEKIFPFPNYVPKMHRLKLTGDSIQILQTWNMRRPDSTNVSGLPNPVGFGNAAEVAWSDTANNCPNTHTVGTDSLGLDPEGIVIGANNTFWVSEEYGTSVLQMNQYGKILNRYTPWGSGPNRIGIDTVLRNRTPNRGFEGLAITPNGKIYAFMQSTMDFPVSAKDTTRIMRILEINPQNNTTRMFVHLNPGTSNIGGDKIKPKDWKIGDASAINDSTFLIIEHAVKNANNQKRIYTLSLSGATPITNNWINGKTLEQYYDSTGLASVGITACKKTVFLDLMANSWNPAMDKPENLAIINDSTIAVGQDNDYGFVSASANGIIAATNLKSTIYMYRLSGTNKIQNYVTPTNTITYPVPTTVTSVNAQPKSIAVYPNPLHQGETLHFSASVTAVVFDITGRQMASINNATELNTAQLSAGMYTIRTNDGNATRFVIY